MARPCSRHRETSGGIQAPAGRNFGGSPRENTKITGVLTLQFGADFFNIFNGASWGSPGDQVLGSNDFGISTYTGRHRACDSIRIATHVLMQSVLDKQIGTNYSGLGRTVARSGRSLKKKPRCHAERTEALQVIR